MRFGRVPSCLLLCALLPLSGCDDAKIGEVSGTVTVDGSPMDAGSITFVPVDGKTSTAGGEIKNGHYSVKVPIGKMKVSISMPRESRKKKLYNTPDSPVGTMYEEGLPAKYNGKTELELEVKSGRNPKNWELTKK
jgi:hypothetical protein